MMTIKPALPDGSREQSVGQDAAAHADMRREPIIQPKRLHVYGSLVPALCDEDVFSIASSMAWHLNSEGYVCTNKADRKSVIYLAHLALGVASSSTCVVRFINDNLLDCRKRNLALVSRQEAGAAARLSKNNKSGFKGVSWSRVCNKWVASINPNGQRVTLGYFTDKESAARAYDLAASKYFGPHARTNFPLEGQLPAAIAACEPNANATRQ